MVPVGTTFIWAGHVWVVISDYLKHSDRKVLGVNLTTMDDECPDDECILDETHYSWIEPNHRTAVAFSRAKLWDSQKLFAHVGHTLPKPREGDIPPGTVAIIIKCALASRELGEEIKALLK